MLTSEQFERTRRLALRLAGIELVERHRALLEHRSRRQGVLDSARMDSLLAAAEAGEGAATQRLLCLLTTKFTGFFRHPRHFEIAAAHALQAVRHRGRARFWTAAAATGEEPYSLAMALIDAFRSEDPPVTILATDVDADALAVAQRGEYSDTAMKCITSDLRARFFNQPDAGEAVSVPGVLAAALPQGASENPPGFGVRWLAGNGADTALDSLPASDAKAGCALTPHPPQSKALRRRTKRDPAPGLACIAPVVRRLVEFRTLNLVSEDWSVEGLFDGIFCRNVLMYLEVRHRHVVLERLASLLQPEGLLLLDPTEHLGKAGHLFTSHANGVYSLRANKRIQL